MSDRSESDDRPEPRYAREVFERLRETLGVLLTDDAVIGGEDSYIKRNYELRDDGAWLRPNGVEDSLDWTPACDVADAPDSPDPLITPALPFPFTARQLAAFMLDGWGWFLHSRFADEQGRLDLQTVQALLGGVRDAKPREAIASAFALLAEARQNVGDPDATLAEAELVARMAFDEATKAAERLHDWRERGIPEPERDARVERRNELTADAWAALKHARKAREKNHNSWRSEVVRWLLLAPSRKLSREEWDSRSNDEKLTALLAGHAPDLTPAEVQQWHVGWCDATIRADYWFGLDSVTGAEAAQLLSRANPLDPAFADWLAVTSEHMSSVARRELLRAFQDLGKARPLYGWLQCAKDGGWRYDPWIDEYITATGRAPATSAAEAPASTRPVSRARAQENAILAKFNELGIDPMRLPKPKPGKSCPPVAMARVALGSSFTQDVMQKAMARLFQDGKAAYTDTPAD